MTTLDLPQEFADIFRHAGPFTSVYLDATRNTESGEHEVELRWRDARTALTRAGAPGEDLSAMDAVVLEDHTPGRHGRAVIAADGELVFDEFLPAPPVQPESRYAPLPLLAPYLAQSAPRLAHIIVVTDRTGAEFTSVPADAAASGRVGVARSITGVQQHPVHKTRRDEWDEDRFQRRVEQSWDENAREVADTVEHAANQVDAQLVVVAGDVRAAGLLVGQLHKQLGPHVEVAHVDAGSRADGAAADGLAEAVRDAVLQVARRDRHAVLDRLRQDLGRDRFAVQAAAPVIEALQRSQAEIVVLSDDPTSNLTAWIGPEPLQVGLSESELQAMGVEHPQRDRFDSAMIRAVVGGGAKLLITPNAHDYLDGGIAAILRYDDRSAN
ncbi:MAG: hypothetical protein JO147_10875 [Actinobacteria bacterium]|nr:hypothetical protein [Actinomycetota bacterium]